MSAKESSLVGTEAAVGHVHVALRVRPLLPHELDRGETEAIVVVPTLSLHGDTANQTQPPSGGSGEVIKGRGERAYRSEKGGAHYAAQILLPTPQSAWGGQQQQPQMTPVNQPRSRAPMAKMFIFDAALGPGATQTDVFELLQLRSYCDDALLEGKAAAVLCYGQTGSGKSFTMSGPLITLDGQDLENPRIPKRELPEDGGSNDARIVLAEESGIAYQAIHYIAHRLNELGRQRTADTAPAILQVVARASYLELYKERIHDLLQGKGDLKCRWSAVQQGFFVENSMQVECSTAEDFLLVLREGQALRRQASHKLNATSSRSHTLFTIYFQATVRESGCDGSYIRHGKLTLVDLAGSERLKDTDSAAGDDTKSINRSLFALGNVIEILSTAPQPRKADTVASNKPALCGKKKKSNFGEGLGHKNSRDGPGGGFVPYRSSVLTQLLMDSLGKNSRTLFIACVTPSSRYGEESLRTLHFAQRARCIRSTPVERVDPQLQERRQFLQAIQQLKCENSMLRAALGISEELTGPLTEELLREHVARLRGTAGDPKPVAAASVAPPPAQASPSTQQLPPLGPLSNLPRPHSVQPRYGFLQAKGLAGPGKATRGLLQCNRTALEVLQGLPDTTALALDKQQLTFSQPLPLQPPVRQSEARSSSMLNIEEGASVCRPRQYGFLPKRN